MEQQDSELKPAEPKPISTTFWILSIALPALVVIGLGWALLHQHMFSFGKRESLEISFRVPGEPVSRSLSQFQGRVVMVTLWSPGCPQCQEQITEMSKVATEYGRDGAMVVAVTEGGWGAIREYVSLQSMPVLAGWMERVQSDALPMERPYSYILNRQGQVVMKFGGVKDSERLGSVVGDLIGY